MLICEGKRRDIFDMGILIFKLRLIIFYLGVEIICSFREVGFFLRICRNGNEEER